MQFFYGRLPYEGEVREMGSKYYFLVKFLFPIIAGPRRDRHKTITAEIPLTSSTRDYFLFVVSDAGDDDYDRLVERLGELNALNKKAQVSFHEDKPRKNRGKGKFQEAMEALKPKRTKVSTKESKPKRSGSSINGTQQQVSCIASSFAGNVLYAVCVV